MTRIWLVLAVLATGSIAHAQIYLDPEPDPQHATMLAVEGTALSLGVVGAGFALMANDRYSETGLLAIGLGTGSLIITPSRRTSPEALRVLKEALANVPYFLWDGQGDNPYFGILGLADFLVVTCDSVNMVSEAASTGKPVYVVDLPGGSEKFGRFHRALREDGITRPFTGKLQSYSYVPPDDMALVAGRVNALFA